MAIPRRPLGKTGLDVSVIGFGCGPTAGLMVNGTPEAQRTAVAHALALGIDYFDTAPAYGNSVSEANLGRTLRDLGAAPHIATKVALEVEHFGDIAGAVVRSIEASVERLRVPRVTAIQLHNRVAFERAAKAEFGTGALLAVEDVLGRGGVIEGFHRARERGLVQFFGCSAYGGDPVAVQSLIDSGAFDLIMLSYSVINPSAWRALPAGVALRDYGAVGRAAARAGMGIVTLRALEGGLLATDEPPVGTRRFGPDETAVRRLASAARPLADRAGRSLPELAVRFALSNPDLSTVLVGFSDETQIDRAVEYAGRGPLDAETLAGVTNLLNDARVT